MHRCRNRTAQSHPSVSSSAAGPEWERRFLRISLPRNSGSRRGVAATEFALILPLLVLLVLGAVDFGRFAHSLIAVSNASRTGAGFAAMHPTTTVATPQWRAAIRQQVLTELGQTTGHLGIADAEVVTAIPDPVVDSGSASGTRWAVSVTVSIPFRTIVASPFLPQEISLSRTTVMRRVR
jgi:Flp pilus assembly protein TadG